jgi:ATP-dependent exoDNAse (exonuclease V) beta subunit
MDRLMDTVRKDFEKLKISGYLKDIILPVEKAYAELPFILRKGKTVFRGRIDRIITRNGTVDIYDYKTFPVKEKELPELLERYRFQMDIYKEAAKRILGGKAKGYLLFTHMPFVVEI